MPPHVQTILVLLGIVAAIVMFLVFINNRDNRKTNETGVK
jgi:hypothetical protein